MKKENVFENDSPTIEMETQTLRSTQHGQQIPFVSGISGYPYSGFAVNQAPAPYAQQPAYGNFGGYPTQQMNPQFYHPGTLQPQQTYPYAAGYAQPSVNGPMTTGYFGQTFPNPYITNQYQGNMLNPVMPLIHSQVMNTPFVQPTPGQFTGVPTPHTNFGPTPMQASPYYQPAINVVDGQYMLLPNQYSPTNTKNGTSLLKNGERDFISWYPNVNILETDRSFKIEICVPGVTKENCQIHVDKNGVLRISGSRRWSGPPPLVLQ